eukprot:GILI01009960.1.p1 GENE.GILI01009960.1~~GILI01009960.1.p1  ORF type:complete len:406 (+),score=34.55 GILI01009960.1:146-1219(+)
MNDLSELLNMAASPDAQQVLLVVPSSCRRLESLLVPNALLSPLTIGDTYEDAMLISLVFFCAVGVLGFVTVLITFIVVRKNIATAAWATSMALSSYPATIIQSLIYLAHGTAIASGLSLGTDDGRSMVPPIVAIVIIGLVAPVSCCVIVYRCCPSRTVVFPTADEKNEMSNPRPHTLVCATVRPFDAAEQFGPLVGDWRIHHFIVPALPFVVPVVLFAVALGLSREECTYVALGLGIVYLIYALVIAVFRPFLGYSHNIWEACVSLSAAACLLAWYSLVESQGSATSDETATILVLSGISNARYPFLLARVLGVILPKVIDIRRSAPLPKQAIETNENDMSRVLVGSAEDEESDFDL